MRRVVDAELVYLDAADAGTSVDVIAIMCHFDDDELALINVDARQGQLGQDIASFVKGREIVSC